MGHGNKFPKSSLEKPCVEHLCHRHATLAMEVQELTYVAELFCLDSSSQVELQGLKGSNGLNNTTMSFLPLLISPVCAGSLWGSLKINGSRMTWRPSSIQMELTNVGHAISGVRVKPYLLLSFLPLLILSSSWAKPLQMSLLVSIGEKNANLSLGPWFN